MSVVRQVSRFSESYREMLKIWLYYSGTITRSDLGKTIKKILDEIRKDSWKSFLLFVSMVHERVMGTQYKRLHRIVLREITENGRRFDGLILNDRSFPDKVWDRFVKELQQVAKEKGKDFQMVLAGVRRYAGRAVRGILASMHEDREANIITFLGKRDIKNASKLLKDKPDGYGGIGIKLAAFVMRDFQDFFHLWSDEIEEDPAKLSYFQPIDRWVERVSNIVWPTSRGLSHDKLVKEIVESCGHMGIEPIKFNQGAWFLAAHLDDIGIHFDIPENKRRIENLRGILRQVDPVETKLSVRRICTRLQNGKILIIK